MKDIILFGGSGFLGSVILKKNLDIISVGRTPPISSVKNPHINIKSLDDLSQLDGIDFDRVIFLIGNSNHHNLNNSNLDAINYNVLPLKQALNYMKHRKLKKFINFSTTLLYGPEQKDYPVSENEKILPFTNEYIFSKYLSEEVSKFYRSSVPVINVRLCNIYGPTHLIRPDLVPTLVRDCILKDFPTIWNSRPIRDFIFVEDASEAIVKLLDTEFTGPINIGSGVGTPVKAVVSVIEKITGKKVIDLNKEVSGAMKFIADISLLKSLINWKPRKSIEDSLLSTYNEMKIYTK